MTRSTARSSGSGSSGDASPAAGETAAKKSSAKRTAKKAPARKAAAKTAPSKGSGSQKPAQEPRSAEPSSGRPRASQVALQAAAHLLDLAGKEAEGIVGISRTEEGWSVRVEVLELRRIPSTTDVLATYEVAVDQDGELLSYRRVHRYVRGTPGED